MRDAVEDHRASSDHAPRTIYGRIVAEADRCIDPATVLRRTVQYGLSHCPALDREGHFERCLAHLRKKYAEGGYLRLWIPESDNARKQEELRALIRDEARLRAAFDAVFDQETARHCALPRPFIYKNRYLRGIVAAPLKFGDRGVNSPDCRLFFERLCLSSS